MARRNLFQPPPPPDTSAEAPASEAKSRFPNTGAMNGVKSTLKDLSTNAVRDISVNMIEDSGPKDRLTFTDREVADLTESIRVHGQQVPIMVRPIAERPGHYRVVYGRRRLRALRMLGIPAKALVRSLNDEQAILAQGQENSQRLDPSFVEKALFAAELTGAGYDQPVILDALAVDKPMLSRMTKVARAIPAPVIEAIGSAHGIGRRRWEELADRVRDHGLDLEAMIGTLELDGTATSEDRFALVADAVARQTKTEVAEAPSPALSVHLDDGRKLAEVKDTPRALTVKLSKTDAPEFARWLHENAETELKRLYEAWQDRHGRD